MDVLLCEISSEKKELQPKSETHGTVKNEGISSLGSKPPKYYTTANEMKYYDSCAP